MTSLTLSKNLSKSLKQVLHVEYAKGAMSEKAG
jgi:hypothetical protein